MDSVVCGVVVCGCDTMKYSAKEVNRNQCFRRWMEDYYAAYQAWWQKAEYETQLYAAELALFKVDFPARDCRIG